jgi:hypothetical protein
MEDATLFSAHGFPELDDVGSDKRLAPTLFAAGANLNLDEPQTHVFLNTCTNSDKLDG